jgi:hypothetical protein
MKKKTVVFGGFPFDLEVAEDGDLGPDEAVRVKNAKTGKTEAVLRWDGKVLIPGKPVLKVCDEQEHVEEGEGRGENFSGSRPRSRRRTVDRFGIGLHHRVEEDGGPSSGVDGTDQGPGGLSTTLTKRPGLIDSTDGSE